MDIYSLLAEMRKRKASDLHIIAGSPILFRIDGRLASAKEKKVNAEESKLLVHSLMNKEQQKRFEQTHDLDFSLSVPEIGRFRINVHLQRGSVATAIRQLPSSVLSLSELHLPPILKELALREKGLILVTGPTGCGKSTTLSAMLDIINNEKAVHVITIEDPIEYLHSDRKSAIEQREVGTDTLSFADSLKYALHQDPDVILVGEMRDLETIAATITAAEAGHLVLATLHTRDAAQAIDRIVDVFPPLQQSQIRLQLSLSLEAVVAQNLLPRKYGEGRIPAVEILVATPAVRNLIRNAEIHQLYLVMETGARFGMQTMDQALKNLVRRGHIDPSLASRLARQAKDFRGSLKSGL